MAEDHMAKRLVSVMQHPDGRKIYLVAGPDGKMEIASLMDQMTPEFQAEFWKIYHELHGDDDAEDNEIADSQ